MNRTIIKVFIPILTGILTIVLAIVYFLLIWMPGASYQGTLPPLSSAETQLRNALRSDVEMLSGTIGQRNSLNYEGLQKTVKFLEAELDTAGYKIRHNRYEIEGKDFEKVIDIYENLRGEVKMDLCASLGILDFERFERLRKTGITMYHHNLETSREYYSKICTTHSYDERIDTISAAKKAGMKVCSGTIIGLGESLEDRVRLALLLRELGVESIPINVLNPIKGTPLENNKPLSQKEILKTIAVFRLINKSAYIRLAGGRNMIDDYGKECFNAGANATITGNYLTTSGNKICDDRDMITELNYDVRQN